MTLRTVYTVLVWLLWGVLGLWMTVNASCIDPEDPSEPGKPSLPDKPCTAFVQDAWTPQERWVWAQVCEGHVADFNEVEGNKIRLDPKKSDGWTAKRTIRQVFLETILLYEPWRGKIPRQGIRISGAWFREPLNLSHAEVKHALVLHCSRFEEHVILLSLHTTRNLLFNESAFTADLIMSGIRVEGALFLRDAQYTHVRLRGAHIDGQLSLSNATVAGMLDMDSLKVGNSLLMDEALLEDVRLRGAHIDGQLSLSNATVAGILEMSSLNIESDLILRSEEPCVEQELHFSNVYLSRVQVGGRLDLSCSIVTGVLKINLSEIKETLDLSGARLPSLDLTGTHIGGELRLARKPLKAQWQSKATLTLRNVTAGAIQDTHSARPDTLVLDGFMYGRSGGFAGDETHNAMSQRDVLWLINWLSKQTMYSSQPYEYLAKILREGGRQEAAKEILYAGKERERAKTCRRQYARQPHACDLTYLPWMWLSMQRVLIGYGHYPCYALFWAIGMTVLGTFVLKCTAQAKKYNMKYWGSSYSLAMLLPIIDLYKYRSDKIDLEGFARVYFYCHHIFGYVLAIFFGAALTGLIK